MHGIGYVTFWNERHQELMQALTEIKLDRFPALTINVTKSSDTVHSAQLQNVEF